MNRKSLVLGGTRFFGKRLVDLLVERGDQVTVVSRHPPQNVLANEVRFFKMERSDEVGMKAAIGGQDWDLVYDQICFDAEEAKASCRLFAGRTGRFIFTSSSAVYRGSGDLTEDRFQASENVLSNIKSYAEGKRAAEAVFLAAPFHVIAPRLPYVLAEDDYALRLHREMRDISEDKIIPLHYPRNRFSLIHANEAATFLLFLGEAPIVGAINGCSDGSLSAQEFYQQIGRTMNLQVRITAAKPGAKVSAFTPISTRLLNTEKATQAGFKFWKVQDWYPKLVSTLNHPNRLRQF